MAVSTGKVPRLPWELMLYAENGPVPNTPEIVEIPNDMLYEIKNARDYLLNVIGSGWQSVETLKSTVTSHLETTMKSDKTFWFERDI